MRDRTVEIGDTQLPGCAIHKLTGMVIVASINDNMVPFCNGLGILFGKIVGIDLNRTVAIEG